MSSISLADVAPILLSPADIEVQHLLSLLGDLNRVGIDGADIFLQRTEHESWMLEDGIIRDADYSISQGFGVRALHGECVGFAYADVITMPELTHAAKLARSIVQSGKSGSLAALKPVQAPALYPQVNPLISLKDQDKVEMLRQLDHYIRARDPRVTNVILQLSSSYDVVLLVHSDGTIAADIRPLVAMHATIMIEDHGQREQASAGGGARESYAFFTETRLQTYLDKALRQALLNIEAQPARAGTMPVVLGPGWAGVILHEAIGHGLEGDFNRKGSSAFTNRLGQQVASPQCTIVDDATIFGRRGSLSVDDEGTPSQCTVLIEQGTLRGYMQDRHNASLMGVAPTGNGRRESYAHQPIPRMTNTYMLPGQYDPAEIIASIDKGIYAVDFSGGQVDITSGKFVFTTSEAYWVEKGKIMHPIKAATLIGDGPEILTKVSMVGNDLELDLGIGVCGKEGQSVPVGVGQPTIRVDEMVVGGR